MFYFTLPVDAPCKAYPARCLASFTCSQEGWRLWEKELPFCASLCLGKKKKNLGNNSLSPTGTMCSSPAVWPCAPDGNGAFCHGVQALPSKHVTLWLDLQVRQAGTAPLKDPAPAAFC